MDLQLKQVYKLENYHNDAVLFFEWLGYSLNGVERFLVWSNKDNRKETISLTNNNVIKLTLV